MEFPGVSKKQHMECPGVNQKRSGISKGEQEKTMWNFHGSQFLALDTMGLTKPRLFQQVATYMTLKTVFYFSLFLLPGPILMQTDCSTPKLHMLPILPQSKDSKKIKNTQLTINYVDSQLINYVA